MVPLRDEKSHITFVHAHTHHTTHTELEHIVKGSHEHVVEVMRQKHVAVADLGFGRVRAQGMGGPFILQLVGGGGGGGGGGGCCKLAHSVRLTMVPSHGCTGYGALTCVKAP